MRTATVWAYQPLQVLNYRTGFVQCPESVAAALIASGEAQDPRVGALCLKAITRTMPAAYETKVMQPEARKRGRPPIKREEPEAPEAPAGGDDAPNLE